MLRFFLEPALSVPLKMTLHGLSFKMQTMCGMSVWRKKQVHAFLGGREKEEG